MDKKGSLLVNSGLEILVIILVFVGVNVAVPREVLVGERRQLPYLVVAVVVIMFNHS